MEKTLSVNAKEYTVIRLLGKGKGGYSCLAERDGRRYVLKQIHHEPCAYYAFTKNPYALKLYQDLGYSIVGHADWRKGRFYLMEKYREEQNARKKYSTHNEEEVE